MPFSEKSPGHWELGPPDFRDPKRGRGALFLGKCHDPKGPPKGNFPIDIKTRAGFGAPGYRLKREKAGVWVGGFGGEPPTRAPPGTKELRLPKKTPKRAFGGGGTPPLLKKTVFPQGKNQRIRKPPKGPPFTKTKAWEKGGVSPPLGGPRVF